MSANEAMAYGAEPVGRSGAGHCLCSSAAEAVVEQRGKARDRRRRWS